MRLVFAACLLLSSGTVFAQTDQPAKPADSPHSTGRTVSPDTQGQATPQGPSGPIETKSGGAPASSPQGQTPPGMQPAPDGSSKTIVEPSKQQ